MSVVCFVPVVAATVGNQPEVAAAFGAAPVPVELGAPTDDVAGSEEPAEPEHPAR